MSKKCYTNLRVSPFTVTELGITYAFSTEARAAKFERTLHQNRVLVTEKIKKSLKINMVCAYVADVCLYATIETRGCFIILGNGDVIEWLEQILFNGGKPTKTN